ncbi:MAG: hypothetical protein J6P06_00320 [Aeriscardovia sp.]|nr:hypothetical protein [Aeriscardovia sp.]
MGKKGLKKRKKLIALLSAAAAVLSLAGGGIGAAFAMAAAKSSASSSSKVSPSLKGRRKAEAEGDRGSKKASFQSTSETKAIGLHPILISSAPSGFADAPTIGLPAGVLPGSTSSEGRVNSSSTSISSSQIGSASIPSQNSGALSLSSGIYLIPFDLSTFDPIPVTSSGALDESQIQNWILSGNFYSGTSLGLQSSGEGVTPYNESTYKPPKEEIGAAFFGGVNPQTGVVSTSLSGYNSGIDNYEPSFEAYVISSCISNSSLPNGEGAAHALGLSSPSPSSCLAAFQKNAEAVAQVGSSSYNLLTYQGLSSLLSILDYAIPSNGETGYQGPGLEGPVIMTLGLSKTLMYFLASGLGYPQSDPAYFFDDVEVYTPPSYQISYVGKKEASYPWVFQQFSAHFRAISQSGKPLKEVSVTIMPDSYPWPIGLNGNWIGADIVPAYWDPEDLNNSAVEDASDSLNLSPPSPYRFFGWEGNFNGALVTLNSISGEPGTFDIPYLVPGTYTVTIAGEGSELADPSFKITLGTNGSESFTSENDPDGFVDASSYTVVTDSSNPSSSPLNSQGEETQNAPKAETGESHLFSYQLSTFLPYSSPLTLSFNPGEGYGLDLSKASISGLPLSLLEGEGASLSGNSISLDSEALSYIEENGYMPATSSSPGGKVKLTSGDVTDRTLSIEIPAYFASSFKAGDEIGWSASYSNSAQGEKGQTLTGDFAKGSALYQPYQPWFRAISENGKGLEKITIKWGLGKSLVNAPYNLHSEVNNSYNSVTLTSVAGHPGLFILPSSLIDDIKTTGITVAVWEGRPYENAYGYTWMFSMWVPQNASMCTQGTARDLCVINGDLAVTGALGFTGGSGGNGLFNPVTRTVIVADDPSIQILLPNGKVDSSDYPTETVGEDNSFTYQYQTVLPYSAVTAPDGGTLQLAGIWSLIMIVNPQAIGLIDSDMQVDGIPFSTLQKLFPQQGYNNVTSSGSLYLHLALGPAVLDYIASHGFMPATATSPVGSSPLDGGRILSVTFKAYLKPDFDLFEGKKYLQCIWRTEETGSNNVPLPQIYTNGPSDDSLPSSLSASDPSSATGLWFENTFENPKDNNKGCSIADSDSYSPTEFTVQNPSGEYLTPVESDGAFEGWEWSGSPYDFKERNSSGDFEWGGLADGTYTVKSVEYPSSLSFTSSLSYSSPQILEGKGTASVTWGHPEARGGAWSFNWYISGGYLDYSDIQGGETDWSGPPPLPTSNLKGSASSACYINPGGPTPAPAPSAPSHLPFTGGKGVLGLSLASSFLFLLGAGVWWGLKKKRGSHASLDSSSKKHGF